MDRHNIIDSDPSDWQQEVQALEEEGRRAFLSRDTERLDALWSDNLVVNSPINRIHDKQQVLSLLRAGVIAHATLQSHVETIQRCGDLVVIMGSETLTNAPDGPTIYRRFTNMWRAEEGSWRMIACHANVIPAS